MAPNSVLGGLEMALWDVAGKATGLAVHELLGGAVGDRIQYFGFPQGNTAEELARAAMQWAESGSEVIYVKVGRGDALDLQIAEQGASLSARGACKPMSKSDQDSRSRRSQIQ